MPDDKDAPDNHPQPEQPAQPPQPEAAQPEGARLFLLNVARLREFVTFLIVVVVVLVFHFKTLPQKPTDPLPSIFLSSGSIKAMLVGISSEAILVVGMVIVIVGGGFDISVGSVLALGGLVTVQALKAHLPLPVAIAFGLLTGALCGLISGLLISRLGMSPLIATLGMMMAARGLVTVHINTYGAASSDDLPASFLNIGSAKVFDMQGFWIVVLSLAVVLVGDVLLRNLRWLRQVYYLGGNERAAALSGINIARVRTVTYVLCGMTAAFAGILNSARFGTATYEAGMGLELQVIAECVIGGASLIGGQGTVIGAFLGVVLLNCIKNGLTDLGIGPEWQYVIVGVGLIFFVTVDLVLAKRRRGQ
jgi:ribose transport system permease protein